MEETYSQLNSTQNIVVKLLLQWVTECTDYTALYPCLNNWLQSVPAGTGYTALYTCFSNWLHMASTYRLQVYRQGTGYTVLTVQFFFTLLVT